MGIGRFAYTPILPLMQNDLTFSNAIAGFLATSNYAGYLVGAILTGIIPLKKHRTASLRASLAISILTTAFMGLLHSYGVWYIIRFLSGVASAFVFVLASSIVLDQLAAKNKSNWSGVFFGGVGFGIFLSGLFTPILNGLFHWKGVWIGLAIISVILAVFVWIWLIDTAHPVMPKIYQVKTDPQRSSVKWLPLLITAYGLEGLGYIVTGTFIVSIGENVPSLNGNPTIVWMVVGLAAVPSCILWSALAKKWDFIKCLVLAMTLQALGIALPVISMSQPSLVVCAVLFGATFMGITTLTTTLARQLKAENSSQIIGYLTAVYAIGQMIGPTIAGVLSTNTHNFNAALLGAAGVVLAGAILLINGIQFEKKIHEENELLPVKNNL